MLPVSVKLVSTRDCRTKHGTVSRLVIALDSHFVCLGMRVSRVPHFHVHDEPSAKAMSEEIVIGPKFLRLILIGLAG